ncbi:MAG: bifunctional adenosylcobinamide kinase/adenosylcobinamide-phosphate guanylyltransferase [Candidatus Dormibacteria bacterium]
MVGGVRSGKSAVACRFAEDAGMPVTFIATGVASDTEMEARIGAHRRARPPDWHLVEEPLNLAGALMGIGEGLVLLDSVDSWVGNLMHAAGCFEAKWEEADPAELLTEVGLGVEQLLHGCGERGLALIAVSCEVGLGPVGASRPTRVFVDLLGHANQLIAGSADAVFLVVAGRCCPLEQASATLEQRDRRGFRRRLRRHP